jgi:hypothetical protein
MYIYIYIYIYARNAARRRTKKNENKDRKKVRDPGHIYRKEESTTRREGENLRKMVEKEERLGVCTDKYKRSYDTMHGACIRKSREFAALI